MWVEIPGSGTICGLGFLEVTPYVGWDSWRRHHMWVEIPESSTICGLRFLEAAPYVG